MDTKEAANRGNLPFYRVSRVRMLFGLFSAVHFCSTWGLSLHMTVRFFNHAVLVLIARHNLVIWFSFVPHHTSLWILATIIVDSCALRSSCFGIIHN